MHSPDDDPDKTNLHRPQLGALGAQEVAVIDSREVGALAAVNPLVAAANPLLMTVASLRPGAAPGNVDALRARLVEMVKEFDAACVRAGISDEHQHLARYALCTVVDETIQRTAWSHAANWAQRSLMVHFFKEALGGEKFFPILDKLVQSPAKHIWLLQLFYVCLSLGFMGRYLTRDAIGRQEITDLRDRLYQQVIRPTLPEADRTLSVRWQGLSVASRQFKGFTAVWLAVGVTLLLCLMFYSAYLMRLAMLRDDTGLGALVIKPAPATARIVAAPPPRPRLPQLLAPEIAARQLAVRESVAESVVTLSSELTFDSGSAAPSSTAVAVIERVAAALEQVDGQVVVTGHTDNVPLRSLQFPSNYELSRARARAVADILRGRLKVPSRVVDEGRGESEPLDGKSGAAKENRRVEISLRVSGAGQ
ncbi:MAG: DotU family type IV/VI secretion system protein [Rubrivivax sp.]|nr:DotU family type IV/VI secretion system protein [Rubrivivax sp.]